MLFNIEYLNSLSSMQLYDLALDTSKKLKEDIKTLVEYDNYIFKTKNRRNKTIEKLNFKQLIDKDFAYICKYELSLTASIKIINKELVCNGISAFERESIKDFLLDHFVSDWSSNEIQEYINKNRGSKNEN